MSSKNPTEAELIALQKLWYDKLKASGFEDIEETHYRRDFLKTCHASYFVNRYHPDVFALKEQYYRMCRSFLHEYQFPHPLEKIIWEHHAEGLSLRKITQLLQNQNIQTNKDKVHKVIRRLVLLMKSHEYDS